MNSGVRWTHNVTHDRPASLIHIPLLRLSISQDYFLYDGCQCVEGLLADYTTYNGLPVIQCVAKPPPPEAPWWQRMPWIFIFIALAAAGILVAAAWWAIHLPNRSASFFDIFFFYMPS